MNISVHKKTPGKDKTEKLKNRIQGSLRKSTAKTAKRVKQAKQAGRESRRALQYAKILSRMVQYDTTSYPYSEEHPAAVQLKGYRGYHRLLEELFRLSTRNWRRRTWTEAFCISGRESLMTDP